MNEDNMLSQEEINELLKVTSELNDENNDQETKTETNEASVDEAKEGAVEGTATKEDLDEKALAEKSAKLYLTELEIDALGEIGNISLGSSATTLSTLLNQKVEITTPSVSVVRKTGLKEEFPYEHVKLQVNYMEGFTGENIFLMKARDAAIISDIMFGGDGSNPKEVLTEIELSAVQEAMNQMMGSSAASMSTVFNKKVDISPPTVDYEDIDKLEIVTEHLDEDEVFVRILFRLCVGDIIDSSIMQIMPLPFAKQLVQDLLQVSETAATATVESAEAPTARQSVQQVSEEPMVKGVEEKAVTQTSQQSTVQQRTEPQLIGQAVDPGATVQQASFAELDPVDISAKGQQNLNLLLDIPLQITVELGRTKQKLEEILELTPGSIIELDKLAGEPVDVFVNSKLIAKGEVVVIDENFGVRITDIVSQKDRLLNLN